MIFPPSDGRNAAQGIMPPSFPQDYVEGAIKPFFVSTVAVGDKPPLPMIELAYSKNAAIPPHLFGLLYDDWSPKMEEVGLSVFLQAYADRGDDNARKRIYASATTPDLWDRFYKAKVQSVFDAMFDPTAAGSPLMARFFDQYAAMYWSLHLGVERDEIPDYVLAFVESFNNVLGHWFPSEGVVQINYMKARSTRDRLRQWVDDRVQDILDRKTPGWESTFVYFWTKNGGLGENFRRKDVVFECYHNLLAFSQWGNTFYNIMLKLSEDRGDPLIREAFERTMRDPDATGGGAFAALERFAMEMMRVLSPNGGSYSSVENAQSPLGQGLAGILHPHPEASHDERHWVDPLSFNPDRYLTAPTTATNDEAQAERAGFVRCPFHPAPRPVVDGRDVTLTNSVYGAVYAVVDGVPYPKCDTAGYAPFGFGYRRCGGEYLTIGAIKLLLQHIHDKGLILHRVDDSKKGDKLPVGPAILIDDDLTFGVHR